MTDRIIRRSQVKIPASFSRDVWWVEPNDVQLAPEFWGTFSQGSSREACRLAYEQCLYFLDLQRNLLRIPARPFEEQQQLEAQHSTPFLLYLRCTHVWKRRTLKELERFVLLCAEYTEAGYRLLSPDENPQDEFSQEQFLTLGNEILKTIQRLTENKNLGDYLLDLSQRTNDTPWRWDSFSAMNGLFGYTCQSLCFQYGKKANKFKLIYTILHGLQSRIAELGLTGKSVCKVSDLIGEQRCTAIARIRYADGSWEKKISFSGVWDNYDEIPVPTKVQSAGGELTYREAFDMLWQQLLKSGHIPHMERCSLAPEMKSYTIRTLLHAQPPVPLQLEDLKAEPSFRKVCFQKHYSCCERKITASLPVNGRAIDSITFYITKEPCPDCEQALKDLPCKHVTVVYEEPQDGQSSLPLHRNCCDLLACSPL